jgi:UDP-N-acetylmuramoylalanine--D-glutamate ligase
VVGLARSGGAAARVLRARGEEVIGVDAGRPPGLDELAAAGVEVHAGSDGAGLLERAGAVVKSPGVPGQAPVVAAARARGLPVLGELELAWRLLDRPWVAITGTNGKTTTTELLGHLHRAAGVPVAVAGNVGRPLAALVGTLAPGTVVVAEASSFQLEDTLAFAPEAAALLNLSEDHLDRHGTMEAYRAAKMQAFARQGPGDLAVHPCDMPLDVTARRVCFGAGPAADVGDDGTWLRWRGEPLLRGDELSLRGPHNRLNAMAAAALALARGLPVEAVRDGLRTFPGVAHRLEEVARRDGVAFVNDSKATNVASALVALRSFPPGSVDATTVRQAAARARCPGMSHRRRPTRAPGWESPPQWWPGSARRACTYAWMAL